MRVETGKLCAMSIVHLIGKLEEFFANGRIAVHRSELPRLPAELELVRWENQEVLASIAQRAGDVFGTKHAPDRRRAHRSGLDPAGRGVKLPAHADPHPICPGRTGQDLPGFPDGPDD